VSRATCLAALALAATQLGCLSRDARPAPAPSKAALFITADVHGYLGPCGCSENMRGGVSRLAGQLDKARAVGERVFLLDAGDGLFGALSIPEAAVGQQERKAKALAEALRVMGLALRTPGPMDDARGAAFRRSLGLPELPAGALRWLDADGHRLAVVAADDVAAANALALEARRGHAAFVVALVLQPFDVALRAASGATNLDLVVAARPKHELSAEENRAAGDGPKVVQVQNKGRSVLRVELSLRDGNRVEWLRGSAERERELATLEERIELMRGQVNEPGLDEALKALKKAKLEDLVARRAALTDEPLPAPADRNAATLRFVPLEASLPESPAVRAIEAAYDRDVGQLNLAWAREHGQDCEAPTPERPGYVGSAACAGCHPAATVAFRAMKHARAYAALVDQGKQHHLDCVTCHVTGWQRPGGVCRIDKTEGRAEVGCEACHGPGSRHALAPTKQTIQRAATPATCTGCHDHENSPSFAFDAYLKAVLVPGHGLPALPGGGPR
jgi:hypothetical protein